MDTRPALTSSRRVFIYLTVFIGTVFVSLILRYTSLSITLSVHSIDGVFQTFSALSRLNSGQTPFVDYFPYLGLITSTLPYPGYTLIGNGTFLGSTFSAYATVTLLCTSATLLLFRINRINIVYSIILLVVICVYSRFLILEPGHSLRPLRALLPFVVAILIYLLANPDRYSERRTSIQDVLVWGLCLSIAPLWSNDYGPPTALAFLITWGLFIADWRAHPFRSAGGAVFLVAAMIAGAWLILGAVSSAPNWWAFLRGTADYQFWYYGGWGEERQILRIPDLAYLFVKDGRLIVLPFLLIGGLLSILIRRFRFYRSPGDTLTFAVALSALGGGLAVQIGGHVDPNYWSQLATYCVVSIEIWKWLAIVPAFNRAVGAVENLLWNRRLVRFRPVDLVFAAACLVFLVPTAKEALHAARHAPPPSAERETARHVLGGTPRFDAREIACFSRLGTLFDSADVPANRRMAASYLSALNLAARAEQPFQADSVIHLLGNDYRQRNVELLKEAKPVLFTTISTSYSPWERWNERSTWPVFDYVYENYDPVVRSDQHIVWLRKMAADVDPDTARAGAASPTCTIEPQAANRTRLTVGADGITAPNWVVLSVDQRVDRAPGNLLDRISRATLMVDEGPGEVLTRFIGLSRHRYGVNLKQPRLEIPVVVTPGESKQIDLVVEPAASFGLTVGRCTATLRMPQRAEPVDRIPMLADCGAFLDTVGDRLPALGYKTP